MNAVQMYQAIPILMWIWLMFIFFFLSLFFSANIFFLLKIDKLRLDNRFITKEKENTTTTSGFVYLIFLEQNERARQFTTRSRNAKECHSRKWKFSSSSARHKKILSTANLNLILFFFSLWILVSLLPSFYDKCVYAVLLHKISFNGNEFA